MLFLAFFGVVIGYYGVSTIFESLEYYTDWGELIQGVFFTLVGVGLIVAGIFLVALAIGGPLS
jgi:hypothetical protein